MAGVAAMGLHGNQIRAWLGVRSPAWAVGGSFLVLSALILSPFVEQRRWPFDLWHQLTTASEPQNDLTTIKDTLADIQRKLAAPPQLPLAAPATVQPPQSGVSQAQYDALKLHADTLQQQLENSERRAGTIQNEIGDSDSIGLDNAKRWMLLKTLADALSGRQCPLMINYMPGANGAKAGEAFGDAYRVLYYTGLFPQSQSSTRTFFPRGISIWVGPDTGNAFNCASKLKDYLDNLSLPVPVTLHANEANADLIGCKDECVNVAIGPP